MEVIEDMFHLGLKYPKRIKRPKGQQIFLILQDPKKPKNGETLLFPALKVSENGQRTKYCTY